jgi:hypothetical protein
MVIVFAIGLVTNLLGIVYFQKSNKGKIPSDVDTAIKISTSAGKLALFFYWSFVLDSKRALYNQLLKKLDC